MLISQSHEKHSKTLTVKKKCQWRAAEKQSAVDCATNYQYVTAL